MMLTDKERIDIFKKVLKKMPASLRDIGDDLDATAKVLFGGVQMLVSAGFAPFPGGRWGFLTIEWSLVDAVNGCETVAEFFNAVRKCRDPLILQMAHMVQGVWLWSFMSLVGKPNPKDFVLHLLRGEWMRESVDENGIVHLDCTFAFEDRRPKDERSPPPHQT